MCVRTRTTTFHDAHCCCYCCCVPTKKKRGGCGGDDGDDVDSTTRHPTTTLPMTARKTTRLWRGNVVHDDVDETEDDQTGRIQRENDGCGGVVDGAGGDSSAQRWHGHPRANGHDATRHQRTMISRDATKHQLP